jgi:flagellar biosynthetic protein FlhB
VADRGQRTEKPTPRRLERARSEGNVPRSRELPSALALLGFILFCHVSGGAWLARLESLVAGSLAHLAQPELDEARLASLASTLALACGALLVVPLGFLGVAGVAGGLVQGPPPLSLHPLRPDLSRVNPLRGLGKAFRLRSWIEMLKVALKMVLFTAVAASAVRDALIEGLPARPGAAGVLAALVAVGGKVMLRVALVGLGVAALDLLFTRFEHRRQLRMTKQEVKDERRETEGDPLVRARQRSKQMALARSRMMADVPKATVVVTNPTEYAVALRYQPGEVEVPRVLAKGRGKIAERIRAISVEHRIPIVEDPPLARALYRSVPVGGFIPAQLFRAVAEVRALVLRRPARVERSRR